MFLFLFPSGGGREWSAESASNVNDFRVCPINSLTQHLRLEDGSGSSQSAATQNPALPGGPDLTFGRKTEGRSPQGGSSSKGMQMAIVKLLFIISI